MKKYNNEKAIISLTSWKARIDYVPLTLYSLIYKCPGFHIVLVLSEDEFPRKEEELPKNLRLFIDNDLIELLWIKPNVSSFKKVLYTMDKYRSTPVINADDGLIYTRNYAEELYKVWQKNQDNIISVMQMKEPFPQGNGSGGILFPPYCFGELGLSALTPKIAATQHDDMYYGVLSTYIKRNWTYLNPTPGFYNAPAFNIPQCCANGLSARRAFDPSKKTEILMRAEIEKLLK